MPSLPCSIGISSVVGTATNSGSLLTIIGTAQSCKIVHVTVQCGNANFTASANVNYNGGPGVWSLVLPTNCICGNGIVVQATCDGQPQCTTTYISGGDLLNCNCCPVLAYQTEFGPCQPDGMRQVTISYTVTPSTDPRCAQLHYEGRIEFPGTGTPPITVQFPPVVPVSGQLVLTLNGGATQAIRLVHANPNGMSCSTVEFMFAVPICETSCCPTLSIQTEFGPCSPNGDRGVNITYTVTPSSNPRCLAYEGILKFPGSNHPAVPLQVSGGGNVATGTVSIAYPSGSSQSVVLIPSASNTYRCDEITLQYTVPPCDDCCPVAIAVIPQPKVPEKCNPDGLTKEITLEVQINPMPKPGCPKNVNAVMYIDGQQVVTGSGTTAFTLTYTGNYACGTHPVTIAYPGTGCPDDGGSFCIPVCETKQCWNLRFLFQIAATSTIISTILVICNFLLASFLVPPFDPAEIAAIVARRLPLLFIAISSAVLWIIFYISWRARGCKKTCTNCRRLLNTWMIMLASFMGFFMLGRCSLVSIQNWLATLVGPTISILIVILVMLLWFIIALLLYFIWIANCCPTKCEKWTRWLETLVVLCGTSVAAIAAVIGGTALPSYWIFPLIITIYGFLVTISYYLKQRACAF